MEYEKAEREIKRCQNDTTIINNYKELGANLLELQ